MTNDMRQDVADDSGANAATGGAGSSAERDLNALPDWARDYIGELRDEAKQRRLEARQLSDDMAALKKQFGERQQTQLTEQGRFKELAEQRAAQLAELEPFKQRAQTLEAMISQSNEARVAQIPENMRGLIPVEYSPEKLAGWLDANLSQLTKPTAPNLDGGVGGSSKAVALTNEQKAMARRMGMSDEDYIAALKKAGQL